MALIGSNKGISKSDINFFAAFTESARKAARALAYVIIIGLVIFGIFLVWLIADVARNIAISSQIATLRAELAGPEYEGLERESFDLEMEMTQRNQYYYALTSMRKNVDETPVASVELCDIIGESIPNEAYISTYMVSGVECTITGYAFSYYNALEMVNMIQSSDAFSDCDISIATVTSPAGDGLDTASNPIDVYYQFAVSATLQSEAYLSVVRFNNTNEALTALGGISSTTYTVGDTYELTDIVNVTDSNGNNYVLNGIRINGELLTQEQLDAVIEDNALTGTIQQNISVELFYNVTEGEEVVEGGEA